MNASDHIEQQLSAYLDGELGTSDVAAIEAAVRDSAALSEELRQLRQTRELVRGLHRAHVGEGFTSRVLAQAGRRRARGGAWIGRTAAAAVLLAAIGVGAIVHATLDRGTSAPRAPRPRALARRAPAGTPRNHDEPPTTLAMSKPGPSLAAVEARSSRGIASAPRPSRTGGAARAGLREPLAEVVDGADAAAGDVTRIELTVADLPAARRQVRAILAAAHVHAVTADQWRQAATAPAAKAGRRLRTPYYLPAPAGADEASLVVVDTPPRVAQLAAAIRQAVEAGPAEAPAPRLYVAEAKPSASRPGDVPATPAARPKPASEAGSGHRYEMAPITRRPAPATAPSTSPSSGRQAPVEPPRRVLVILLRLAPSQPPILPRSAGEALQKRAAE